MELKPYGSWKSPITSSMIVESAITLGNIVLDEQHLYWNEFRPQEKGRSVVMVYKEEEQKFEDFLSKPYNARSKVHEYGGGSFTVNNGTLYFSNASDQHFYSQSQEGKITDLTQDDRKRYANPIFDKKRNTIYAIEEEHRDQENVTNTLVKIDANGSGVTTIHKGWDFYGMPAIHPKHTHLAFITWNHPNMPWDSTTLWVGELKTDGSFLNIKKVAGGLNESIFQPQWNQDGELYFISDKTGFWNIYRLKEREIHPCHKMDAEFGQPFWVFGLSRYGFLSGGKIACIYTTKGTDNLGIIDPKTQTMENIALPFTELSNLQVKKNILYFIGASHKDVKSIVSYDFRNIKRLRVSKELKVDLSYISIPQLLKFPTENNKTAYGFFYSPKNKDYLGINKPPLIVKSHGGPSSHATPSLNLEIQFWTSRGFAVLDVNYGGSTGYGREYRERLRGNWGVVDVDDCTNGALFLAKEGKVDREKIAIKGSSAGGYTTLAAIAFKNIFKAGVSYYGVSDLEALAKYTHKFEARYLDGLIGPYPEKKDRYIDYSPIHHTDQINCPVILFQGSKDKVVPPSQSEMLFKALDKKKIPTAYVLFEGEQHGFKMAETIKNALEIELYFYSKIFKFYTNESLKTITIKHLK